MARRPLSSADLGPVILLWLPLLAVAGAVTFGWQPSSVLSAAGLAGLAATWILVVAVLQTRAARTAALVDDLDQLWLELGLAPPDAREGLADGPLGLAERSLRQLRGAVEHRLSVLAVERDTLRAVLDAAASPVLATDAAGGVLFCNDAADDFFDRRTPLLGRSIEELFTQAEILGQHAAALAGTRRQGQIRLLRPDGFRVFQVLTSPLAPGLPPGAGAAAVAGVVITLRDITELAVAVQLKTDFVANASHELRTPLSSIRAAVETLADGAWDDAAMRGRLAQMIGTNVTRLEEMVRDLLDLSRLETPDAPVQVEPFALAVVVESLAETFEGVCAERTLTLEFDVDPRAAHLRTDPKLLTLILKNLIDNATKFAYPSSTVRVVARPLPPDPAGARPGDAGRAGLRLRVADRGVGIPLGHQHRVFERFFQVDPSRAGGNARRGTGLGLAIVKHAVKTLGGTIAVESVWKQGTTMTVEIPGVVEGADPSPRA